MLFLRLREACSHRVPHQQRHSAEHKAPASLLLHSRSQDKMHMLFKTPGGSAAICQHWWNRRICSQDVGNRNIVPVAGGSGSSSLKLGFFFFFLPSNRSGEKLQERKRFVMLTEVVLTESGMVTPAALFTQGGGRGAVGGAWESRGLCQVQMASVRVRPWASGFLPLSLTEAERERPLPLALVAAKTVQGVDNSQGLHLLMVGG